MDANTIITMVGSLGFPIVACIFMAIFFNKVNENYRSDIKELSSNHKEEMAKVTEAIANNNTLLERILDRLDEKEGFINDK